MDDNTLNFIGFMVVYVGSLVGIMVVVALVIDLFRACNDIKYIKDKLDKGDER